MRKGTKMVALVALLVAIFATAAYAATIINCNGGTCYGTNGEDEMYETSGNDQIYGFRGDDYIDAYSYEGDRDKLYGGRNNDDLYSDDGDGDDLIVGGRGQEDECFVDFGDEVHSCDGNVARY